MIRDIIFLSQNTNNNSVYLSGENKPQRECELHLLAGGGLSPALTALTQPLQVSHLPLHAHRPCSAPSGPSMLSWQGAKWSYVELPGTAMSETFSMPSLPCWLLWWNRNDPYMCCLGSHFLPNEYEDQEESDWEVWSFLLIFQKFSCWLHFFFFFSKIIEHSSAL